MNVIFKGKFSKEEKDEIRLTLLKENLILDEYTRNRDFIINKINDYIEVIRKI